MLKNDIKKNLQISYVDLPKVGSMSPCFPSILKDSLCNMFPEEWLRQTAKEIGLIVRERKIDPVIIFWVRSYAVGS